MAINFYQVANDSLAGSPVMQGREKITTEALIASYPNGITITEFDIIGSQDKSYPVFAFAEDPTKFFNGGSLAMKIALAWVGACDGDIESASSELKASGGVKFRVYLDKTKKGRNITRFDPVKQ